MITIRARAKYKQNYARLLRAVYDVGRDAGADILVVARTDARQAHSLQEALWRAEAFAAAGADVLFIDALESVDELAAFGSLGGSAASVPKAPLPPTLPLSILCWQLTHSACG